MADEDEEVLTEGEIEALMETVEDNAGGADAHDDGAARRFDFGAREQSALRQFTALEQLLERQAELLAEIFDQVFSIEFEVRSTAPTALSIADLVMGLEQAAAVSTGRLNPLIGPCFVVSPASFLSFLVNAYFGGGVVHSAAQRDELTPSELRIGERVCEILVASLMEAWQDKLPLEPVDFGTADSTDRMEMLPPTDMLIRFSFVFQVEEFEGESQILIPFDALEPHQTRFQPPKREQEEPEPQASWEPHLRRELPGIEVELAAILETQSISLADVLDLKEGSVLPMAPPEQVSLRAEDMVLAEGRYGTFEGAKAVLLQRLGRWESA